jgi:hypothetical protein
VVDTIRPTTERETTVDRARAHLALITHVPVRDWRWLGLRLRCRYCAQPYPCPPRRDALAQLTDGI